MSKPILTRCVLSILLVAVLMGCGSEEHATYPARGTVRLADGTPVTKGIVEFESIDHPTIGATGQIESDGSFVLSTFAEGDGAVLGRHQATVVVEPTDFRSKHKSRSPISEVPAVYELFATSGVEFTVTNDANKNVFEIVLGPK